MQPRETTSNVSFMHPHHLHMDSIKHCLNRKICLEVQCPLMQSVSILGNIIARFFMIYLDSKRFRLDISMFLDHDRALNLNTPRLYLHLLKPFYMTNLLSFMVMERSLEISHMWKTSFQPIC